MKNIVLSTIASIGLSAAAQAQTHKSPFQYDQEIIAVFQKAIQEHKVTNPLPMTEGDSCYEFKTKINGVSRQVYYCTDKKYGFIDRIEKPVSIEERKNLLDSIKTTYSQ